MLYWLIYPVLEAFVQSLLFKHVKGFDPHKEPIFLRLTRGIAYFSWAIWLQYENNMQSVIFEGWNSLWFFLLTVTYAMTSFWILFDLFLNKFRNKPWNHTGVNSGYLDNIQNYLFWKGVALVGAIGSLLLFWHVF
jgi:hypothetical protein